MLLTELSGGTLTLARSRRLVTVENTSLLTEIALTRPSARLRSFTQATAAARAGNASLPNTLLTWNSTVRSVMCSCRAMSRLLPPRLTASKDVLSVLECVSEQ